MRGVRPNRSAGAPVDFVAFVATHAAELRRVAVLVTGDEPLADVLVRDALATAAGRWARYSGRPASGVPLVRAALDRGLTDGGWATPAPRARARLVMVEPPHGVSPRPLVPAPARPGTALAEAAWSWARTVRRRRRLAVAALVAMALLVIAVGHARPVGGTPRPIDGLPPPTVVAALDPRIDLIPPPEDQPGLPRRATVLPERITTGAAGLPTLAEAPVDRALAVFMPDRGTPLVLGGDGRLRRLVGLALPPALAEYAGQRSPLSSTSLAPDGTRVAFLQHNAIVVADLRGGGTRRYPLPGYNQELVWRSGTTLLVAQYARSFALDLGSGAVTAVPYHAGDVAAGGSADDYLELPAASAGPTLVRRWPAGATPGVPGGEPVTAALNRDGLAWVGDWRGPGWRQGTLVARDCAAHRLDLPADAARAVQATVVTDVTARSVHRALVVSADSLALGPTTLLGWLDDHTVLVKGGDQRHHQLLAWNVERPGDLRLVSVLDADIPMSIALPG